MRYFIIILICGLPHFSSAWGFYGHKFINQEAIYALPPKLYSFYKSHEDYIILHSTDPDKRRYAVKNEAEKHYLDLDCYSLDSVALATLKTWKSALSFYKEEELRSNGILPWNIVNMYHQLINAFRVKNIKQIVRISTELGHYIGDGHVPLHTTENYNGQLTNQEGIHSLWESRIPELFGETYTF